jgi:hypothetical protein
VQARQAYDAGTSRLLSEAMASYNVNGWSGMSPALKERLNGRHDDERGPALYNRLQEAARAKYKAHQGSKSDQQRWQTQQNRDAMNDFLALPVDVQATIDLSPQGTFAQEHPNADVHGFKAIGPKQRHANEVVEKGDSVGFENFVTGVEADAESRLPPARTKKERDERAAKKKAARARGTAEFMKFREKHSGNAPSVDEAAALRADIKLAGGLAPRTDEQAEEDAEAHVRRAGAKQKSKVGIAGPDGRRALADEDGLDDWLKAHPGWKRQ